MITSGGNRNPAKLDLGAGGSETAGHHPSLPRAGPRSTQQSPRLPSGSRSLWVVAGIIVQLPFLSRPVCLPVLARLWRPRHTGKMAHARELAELLAALWVPKSSRRCSVPPGTWLWPSGRRSRSSCLLADSARSGSLRGPALGDTAERPDVDQLRGARRTAAGERVDRRRGPDEAAIASTLWRGVRWSWNRRFGTGLRRYRPRQFATAAFCIDLLAERGPLLGDPYTRQLGGKLWELRFHLGRRAVRVTYWVASGRQSCC